MTKKITLPKPEYKKDDGALNDSKYITDLQTEINKAFGDKVKLEKGNATNEKGFSLKFSTTQAGSTLSVSGDAAKALGLDKAATYVNTSKTLGELLGDKNG